MKNTKISLYIIAKINPKIRIVGEIIVIFIAKDIYIIIGNILIEIINEKILTKS